MDTGGKTDTERLKRWLFVQCVRDAMGLSAHFDVAASDLSGEDEEGRARRRRKSDSTQQPSEDDDGASEAAREERENELIEFYSDGGHEENIQFVLELFGSYWDVESSAFRFKRHEGGHGREALPIAGPESSKKRMLKAKRRKSTGTSGAMSDGNRGSSHSPDADGAVASAELDWRQDMMAIEQMFEHTPHTET
ncbi:hypothetical protein STCU_11190 [Strigomonas culicis]|uniref:Uncharacterized protein n=1 Tax=Strigomonas culicis TaxID=28005 RepID=S9UPA1_9TRYP|nr:hypothetical protein STCU_11190 [Strigomonas culicis]|eukprot:EPY16501.1 hypothetical protein STCU_11190 [Strigomonas culicis]